MFHRHYRHYKRLNYYKTCKLSNASVQKTSTDNIFSHSAAPIGNLPETCGYTFPAGILSTLKGILFQVSVYY